MNVQPPWNNFCTKLKHIFGMKILLIAIFFEENWICSIHRILWQVTLMSRTPHSHAHTRTRRTAHVCAHTLFHYSLPCRNSPTGPTTHTYIYATLEHTRDGCQYGGDTLQCIQFGTLFSLTLFLTGIYTPSNWHYFFVYVACLLVDLRVFFLPRIKSRMASILTTCSADISN